MSTSTDTVTAEVVLAPIAGALTASHGRQPSKSVCLLFREDNILVAFSGLDFGEPHAEVFEVRKPEIFCETCEVVEEIELPVGLYQAAKDAIGALNKLKQAAPFLDAARKRQAELFEEEQERLRRSMPQAIEASEK